MNANDIIRHRINVQQLGKSGFTKAAEVVAWLGAVQAQDYFGSLWSVGMRMKKSVEADVEKAIASRTIVRTWPMRGTLHFVSPEDVRWMLKYLTPKVIARTASYYRKAELNEKVFSKCAKLWIKALEGNKQLTRDEMYDVLERARISTANTRGLFILGHLAQQGIICFGPRKGKQHTFTLLDEWLPAYPMLKKDEAMAELALRYYRSHGPATIEDFMWWAGLTKADANAAINAIRSNLSAETFNDQTYLFSADLASPEIDPATTLLLPTFDEYGIAYKDRSAIIDPSDYKKVGGLFTSSIVIKGKVTGSWRRTIKNDRVRIETKPFRSVTKAQRSSINKAIERYSKFVGLIPEYR